MSDWLSLVVRAKAAIGPEADCSEVLEAFAPLLHVVLQQPEGSGASLLEDTLFQYLKDQSDSRVALTTRSVALTNPKQAACGGGLGDLRGMCDDTLRVSLSFLSEKDRCLCVEPVCRKLLLLSREVPFARKDFWLNDALRPFAAGINEGQSLCRVARRYPRFGLDLTSIHTRPVFSLDGSLSLLKMFPEKVKGLRVDQNISITSRKSESPSERKKSTSDSFNSTHVRVLDTTNDATKASCLKQFTGLKEVRHFIHNVSATHASFLAAVASVKSITRLKLAIGNKPTDPWQLEADAHVQTAEDVAAFRRLANEDFSHVCDLSVRVESDFGGDTRLFFDNLQPLLHKRLTSLTLANCPPPYGAMALPSLEALRLRSVSKDDIGEFFSKLTAESLCDLSVSGWFSAVPMLLKSVFNKFALSGRLVLEMEDCSDLADISELHSRKLFEDALQQLAEAKKHRPQLEVAFRLSHECTQLPSKLAILVNAIGSTQLSLPKMQFVISRKCWENLQLLPQETTQVFDTRIDIVLL